MFLSYRAIHMLLSLDDAGDHTDQYPLTDDDDDDDDDGGENDESTAT